MTDSDVALAVRAALTAALKLGAPILLTALVTGLVVSLIQAVTQINEATLAFVPKVIAVGAVLTLLGSFMLSTLQDEARQVFADIATLGRP